MSETKPTGDQINFNSSVNGTTVLDDYLEAAELGGRTLADLLSDLFDVNGDLQQFFELREDPDNAGTLQIRYGTYVDPEAGWEDFTETDFASYVTNAEAAQVAAEAAQTAAESAETNAASSESTAVAAQSACEIALDEFTDIYLGSKAADPTLDNDGNALQVGALYFNNVANELRVYSGLDWNAPSSFSFTGLLDTPASYAGGASKFLAINVAETAIEFVDPPSATNFKGEYDANTNTPDLDSSPISTSIGDTYIVSAAGNFFTVAVEVGDMLIANKDSATVEADWAVIQANLTSASIKTQYESNSDTNAFTDAEQTKLSGIESNATADQTGAEIKTAYEAEADTNAFTDTEKTKLSNIEDNATADQTGAEIKTAYEGEANTNAFTDAEQTKLSAIEPLADVTDATNVAAAGAGMLNTTQTWTAAQRPTITTLSWSTNIATPALDDSNDFSVTLESGTANTIANPSDIDTGCIGQTGDFVATQHASSASTLAWGSYYKDTAGNAFSDAIATSLSSVTTYSYRVISATHIELQKVGTAT